MSSHARGRLAAAAVGALAATGAALVVTGVTEGQGRSGQTPAARAQSSPQVSSLAATTGAPQVSVVQSADNSTVGSSATPQQLPGMVTTVTVPAGQRALLIVRFSAETACYGDDAGQPDWCTATAKVNGVEMAPATGADFAFDSTDSGTESSASWESHAMERYRTVSEGTKSIRIYGSTKQFGSTQPTFWTGERQMTVEVWPLA